MHTQESRNNTIITECTSGAISPRPTVNAQGGWQFMRLASGREIVRRKWTTLPMPNAVIYFVHGLSRHNPCGIIFTTTMFNLFLIMMITMTVMMTPTSPVTPMTGTINTPLLMMKIVSKTHPLLVTIPSQECMTTMMIMHYILSPLGKSKALPLSKKRILWRKRRR